ncbi:Ff.00g124750.m01.CDS01 [Fusarium sp. VM40]|nr:Ff.00g124750.m01.CDS01 [Fusarium sp. VM40]
MAADLIMPTLPGDQHSRHFFPQQRPTHSRNQSYQISVGPQISPINTNTSTSPDSISSDPTSPRAYQGRQNRPMYMPAALRPNLFPSKTSRMPMDDAASASSTESENTLRRTNSSLINIPGMSVFSNKLARVSTGDSAQSSIDGDFDLDMFPEVKDQPTRKHWKPDSESTVCDDPTCKRTFSYFTRRHHCRKCGHIFCDSHSTYAAPLDHDAKFNPRAPLSRTCRHCCEEFKSWYTRNSSRASSAASSDAPNPTPSTPITAGFGDASDLPRGPELAASVPRDWNWSTF